jgi:hypothetical protein
MPRPSKIPILAVGLSVTLALTAALLATEPRVIGATGQRTSSSQESVGKGQASLEKDLARTRLSIIPAGDAGGARAIVALGMPTSSADVDEDGGKFQPILARELIRQAALIAARDELGLGTRDEVIGDRLPENQGATAAEIGSVFRPGPGGSRILLRRGQDANSARVLSRDLPGAAAEPGYLSKLTVQAEALSRSDLPAALKSLGLSGKPAPFRAGALVPAAIEDRLEQLGFVENLAAVRDLHEAIRKDGESSERLGALVRGYINLGIASEFHWHPAHKAFKARALLYAQRLAAREPDSPWGLWHRAFAKTLIGLPSMSGPTSTRQRSARMPARPVRRRHRPPGWV